MNHDLKQLNEYQGAKLYQQQDIYIVDVHGSWFEMGEQYGHLMKDLLTRRFNYLNGIHKLEEQKIEIFEKRYPTEHFEVIKGVAKGSGLPKEVIIYLDYSRLFDMVKKFNGMGNQPGCCFVGASKEYTTTQQAVVGRNLDWIIDSIHPEHEPIVVGIFRPSEAGANQLATFGYPGWVSPITVLNDQHLFLEGNSGRLSIGDRFILDCQSLEGHFLQHFSRCNTLDDTVKAIEALDIDEGALLNIADTNTFVSVEVAPEGKKCRTTQSQTHYHDETTNELMVATNTFRMPGWEALIPNGHNPYPEHGTTESHSFIRYDNLLSLSEQHKGKIDLEAMKTILSTRIENGGACELPDSSINNIDYTYLCLAIDMASLKIAICCPVTDAGWTHIDLMEFFNQGS